MDLDPVVKEVVESINPDSPANLLQAARILVYCGKEGDVLKTALEDCNTEILELQSHGHGSIRLINDAIHGPIELSPLVYKIINTPEFHRLKNIKQLGAANYVYPGANHTRFDHSIGVFFLAGEFAQHLQRQAKEDFPSLSATLFTDGEVICTQLAGLCHDLGHGPFSHLFERYVMKSVKHEVLSVNILKKLLSDNINVLAEFVSSKEGLGIDHLKLIEFMIQPPEKLPRQWTNRRFLCEIVANKSTGVDVDKWDYYSRDCHYLGVTTDFQQKRCMLLGRIVEDSGEYHIAFRDKELDNIYGMFRTRAVLHQKAYQHKTIKAVERMIADAILEIKDHIPIIQILGSEKPVSIKTAIEEAEDGHVGSYLALNDSIIELIKCCPTCLAVNSSDCQILMKAKEILRRIETRDLYHCSGKVRIPKVFQGLLPTDSLKENESNKKENNLWRALVAMSKQPEGESITEFLALEKQGTIEEKDLWMPTEKIKLPSEEEDNPITEIRFYKKPKGDGSHMEVCTKEEVREMTSLLVVPQVFIECEVRVYDKRRSKDRANDDEAALREALLKWKRNVDIKHNNGAVAKGCFLCGMHACHGML